MTKPWLWRSLSLDLVEEEREREREREREVLFGGESPKNGGLSRAKVEAARVRFGISCGRLFGFFFCFAGDCSLHLRRSSNSSGISPGSPQCGSPNCSGSSSASSSLLSYRNQSQNVIFFEL